MRWQDAIRDDLEVHRIAVGKQGAKSFFAVASLSDAATAQCRGGRLQDGVRSSGNAYDAARAAFGPDAALTQAVGFTLAECLIQAKDLGRASRLLADVRPDAVAQLAADPHWGANLALAKARIAWARRDLTEARRQLAQASALKDGKTDPYQRRAYLDLEKVVQAGG